MRPELLAVRPRPHAEAEEKFLYPELARILGNAHALAPMSYDHQMIATWTAALAEANLADTVLLQELLFGLHTVIRMHFWKEEEIYFPLLDAEPEAAVRRILKDMDAAIVECAEGGLSTTS